MNFRYIIFLLFSLSGVLAYSSGMPDREDIVKNRIVRKHSINLDSIPDDYKVIVDDDTVSMILPQRNYGRYDRGLYNFLYIPKKSWAFGITASYGSLNTEDLQLLSYVKDFNFEGKIYSIKPSVAYFIDNNQSIGLRYDFSRGLADLNSLAIDFDDDLNFSLHDVSYHSQSHRLGIFYRNYVGLGMAKRFAIFNEVALDGGWGNSRFKRYYGEQLYDTETKTGSINLNFSPGLCIFIQDYVAFNLSFGVFGLHYTDQRQTTNGADDGQRISSGANFKFNIFNLNFGLLVVI